jgi:dienelactone hydrolase
MVPLSVLKRETVLILTGEHIENLQGHAWQLLVRSIVRPVALVLYAAISGLTAQSCIAAEPQAIAAPSGPLNEQVFRVAVSGNGAESHIVVTLFRPRGSGPFPLVVINHGSPRNALARRLVSRYVYRAASTEFVNRGYAVALPTRRGYGDSGGEWAENYGSCNSPDYYAAGLETARDITATVNAMATLPFIDRTRVVLVGHSAGGWGSLAAITEPPAGTVAVINFAAGRGSRGPENVCGEQRLIEAAARYGERAKIPSLWIYSENDKFFGPRLAQALFAAYKKGGAKAEFVTAPATGDDGHNYFLRDVSNWTLTVDKFLRELALP